MFFIFLRISCVCVVNNFLIISSFLYLPITLYLNFSNLHQGPSSIHEFVRLAVDQKNNPHHHNYIRKRHPDEVRHCLGEMSVALKMTEGGQRLPKFPQLPSHLGS